MNIYISGVGGQGVGMLSEILVRAIDYGGHNFRAVDTHGLAQRGGTVVSQIRYGHSVYTPLIRKGKADLVIALEVNEAFRSMELFLKEKGTLVFYNTIWEPLNVRLGTESSITAQAIADFCKVRNRSCKEIFDEKLIDSRMQNIVVLSGLINHNLLKGVTAHFIEKAMADLMDGSLLEKNMKVFKDNLN